MKSTLELINNAEPGWTLVDSWIKNASNKVEILTRDSLKANDALFKTQVSTRSPMGAIVYMKGGILIDDSWIRILGSGNPKLPRTLPDWNKNKSFNEFGENPSFLLIADDVIGGFFILNCGFFGDDLGKTYYLSPDLLTYEPLNITYSEFLQFCFNGDLDRFYGDLRWKNWREEVSKIDGDKAFSFYPYLWTKEGKDINKNVRKAIPIEELYMFTIEMQKQLGDLR